MPSELLDDITRALHVVASTPIPAGHEAARRVAVRRADFTRSIREIRPEVSATAVCAVLLDLDEELCRSRRMSSGVELVIARPTALPDVWADVETASLDGLDLVQVTPVDFVLPDVVECTRCEIATHRDDLAPGRLWCLPCRDDWQAAYRAERTRTAAQCEAERRAARTAGREARERAEEAAEAARLAELTRAAETVEELAFLLEARDARATVKASYARRVVEPAAESALRRTFAVAAPHAPLGPARRPAPLLPWCPEDPCSNGELLMRIDRAEEILRDAIRGNARGYRHVAQWLIEEATVTLDDLRAERDRRSRRREEQARLAARGEIPWSSVLSPLMSGLIC